MRSLAIELEHRLISLMGLDVPAAQVLPIIVRKTFAEWKQEDRVVMKGQRGTRDPADGLVKFTYDQTREIPTYLWDDLGHEGTDYDGDGY